MKKTLRSFPSDNRKILFAVLDEENWIYGYYSIESKVWIKADTGRIFFTDQVFDWQDLPCHPSKL